MTARTVLLTEMSREHTACPCGCGFMALDTTLREVLRDLCAHFGQDSFIATSWCRCPEYNKKVGGARRSRHQYAMAVDLKFEDGPSAADVAEYLRNQYPNTFGIGEYRTFVHLDVRPEAARWTKK